MALGLGGEGEGEGDDVIDTFHGDGLVVIHRRHGEAHLVEFGPAIDDQVHRLLGQQLRVVVDEGVHVGDLHILIHVRGGCLGGVHGRELDVGVWLVLSGATTDG